MFSQVLVALLAATISGSIGFFVSRNFWRTGYSATNKSGDFGSPRGGFFATMAGMLVGMFFFGLIGKYFIPAATLDTAFITCMIAGAIAGFVGMASARKERLAKDQKNQPQDKQDNTK